MMSVKEYALDIKISVDVILEKCKELDIKVFNENDMLSEENIIDLDNNIEIEDVLEDIVSNIKIDDTIKKEKLNKKVEPIKNDDFVIKKKEMYKNKEKLISNTSNSENIIVFKDSMTVSDLANLLGVSVPEIIKKYMALGFLLNVNSKITFDETELVLTDYNKILKKQDTQDASNFEKLEITDSDKDLELRPPVVTIMGHVDHGKTSLLDAIRKSNVVEKESGGITQHIGAYQIKYNEKKITFIDTPGHSAFTEMRARGASITDIVIIVVAADEGIKPQTKEAIDHAKAAKVPIIVAINKIDKPNINLEKVMTELADYKVMPEEWGGDTPFVKVSALTLEGLDSLLETILLISEMANLKANPNRYAIGTVIESKLDKNIGPVTTLLIQNGTLRLGDPVVVGSYCGKVRTLKNDLKNDLVEALPSTPVEITGLCGVPSSGDKFMAFESEKQAKSIADTRKIKEKQKNQVSSCALTLDDLFKTDENIKELNVIIKADVKGSEEAIKTSLEKLAIENVKVNIIRSATGNITESDVVLANASCAIILGFNVEPSLKTKEIAKDYCVEIRLYNVIYKIIEDLEKAMEGMLDKVFEEKTLGKAEIRKIFKFSKVGQIAGSYILEGIIKSNNCAKLIRNKEVVYTGKISSIQREKESVKEVKKGLECGITLDDFNDFFENDIIECYELVEVKRWK